MITIKTQVFGSILLLILISTPPIFSIEVEGEVSGAWSLDDSPVSVVDMILIPEGEELIIEPGVVVIFNEAIPMLVHGNLIAEGTEEDSIFFQPVEDSHWGSIRATAGASIALSYCVIRDSRVGDEEHEVSGGAIFCEEAELLISNSTFTGNQCSQHGGAIHIHLGEGMIEECCFFENEALHGAAIYCERVRPCNIRSSQFRHNLAVGNGGGICINNMNDQTRIQNNKFIENSAAASGGIGLTYASPVISGNEFYGNESEIGSALLISNRCAPQVYNNIFAFNSAEGLGATIYFQHMTGLTEFKFNTIFNNEGGAIVMIGQGYFRYLNLRNCIFWGNQPQDTPIWTADEPIYLSYCCFESEWVDSLSLNLVHDNPLFIDPEDFDFSLSQDSPCIDSGDPNLPEDPDGTRSDIGAIPFDHNAPDPVLFRIPLVEGWNMVSSFVDPEDNNIRNIFSDLVEEDRLLLAKNGRGNFYVPQFNFNNIPFWDVTQGYQIKVTEDCELTIAGNEVEADTPIQLNQNWNLISYFPQAEVEAPVAFRNIAEELIIVKDGAGHFYIPEHDFNNIPPLSRGCGYQVKVSEEIEFIWNY